MGLSTLTKDQSDREALDDIDTDLPLPPARARKLLSRVLLTTPSSLAGTLAVAFSMPRGSLLRGGGL